MRSLVLGLGLAAGSTLVAVLAAEGGLRLFPGALPPAVQVRLHWQVLRSQDRTGSAAERYLGALPTPHRRTELRQADFHFTFETDRLGFRNAEPWPDTADIVAIGDSWVFGYGADLADSWLELVTKALPGVRAVNLGIVGAGPQQYVRAYERYGVQVHPKVLILGLFPGNDLDDALTFDEWLREDSPGNYDDWKYVRRKGPQLGGGLFNHSYLVLTIREVLKNRHSPFEGTTITLGDGSRLRLAPGFFKTLPRRARPGEPDFERVLASLDSAASLSRRHGTQLLVLLFPTKEAVYLPTIGKPAPVAVEAFRPELEARGIDYIDFLPIFQSRARAGEGLYFEVDGHPNANGNRVIGATVVDYLRRHAAAYGLDAGAGPRSADSH